MKIAVVRGDFLSGWEIPVFEPWTKKNKVTLFVGKKPIYKVTIPKSIKVVSLFSPVDLNFGRIRRYLMAILNRVFIDAHVLFGLEEKLKGYDIAYTAETFYNFSLQCVRAKKKGYIKAVVMHVGENIAFNNEGIGGRKALKQEVIANTDKFIAITDKARDVLITEGADPKKIIRLNPGINTQIFFPKKRPEKTLRLLTVSRLVPEKGIKEMVEVFKKLRKIFPNLEFTVVGVGPEEKWLDTPGINRMPNVLHKDMPGVYQNADIYVHYPVGSKTWLEQWGFVLAEAMACGLPVVALNRGSVSEVLQNAGYLVNSKQEFYKTLKRLIGSKKLRENTKVIRYDVKKFSNGVAKIFKQCLKK